jgi:REP element-mobilizing transposase RayT
MIPFSRGSKNRARGGNVVLAYHVIFGAYGFWLPNDPRGSWSDFVWAWELRRFGPATTTTARRSVAHATHNRYMREAAKMFLKYPAVKLQGIQAVSAARGFARVARDNGYSLYALSILPEHVHMVIGRHHYSIEQVVRALKQGATEELINDDRHPLRDYQTAEGAPPPPWARGCWKVFLDEEADIARAVKYVNGNPEKEHLAPQRWSCVCPWQSVDLRSTAKHAIEKSRQR